MNRTLLEVAAVTLLATAFAFAQVTYHTSLYDYRFGLAALAMSGLGVATGVAISVANAVRWRTTPATPWLAGASVAAAATVIAALFLPFGTYLSYFLLTLAAVAVAPLATLAITALLREQPLRAGHRAVTLVGAALVAAVVTSWLVSDLHGPVPVAAIAAVGLGLISYIRGGGRAAKVGIASAAAIIVVSLQAHHNYSAPPRWVAEGSATDKPLYREEDRGDQARYLATLWQGFSRTDVVAFEKIRGDLLWLAVNGLPAGLLPANSPRVDQVDSLRRRFALHTLAMEIGQPAEAVVVKPAGGLEMRIALDGGARYVRGIGENGAMAALLRGAGRDLTGLLARPGALLTVGNARAVLEREGRQYDQIILPVPYGRAGGWGAPRWCENYLYTREALQTYWDHLRPGGSLAFLTADEPLFMRALLAVWQATEGEGAGAGSFGRHSWGFEIASLDPLLTPYRYLLLAVKGEVTEAQQQHAVQLVDRVRARGLSKGTALSALFGPGVVAKRQYQALFRVGGLTAARTALSRAVSWRMKSFADLSAATDVRPFLFRMERDLHPLLKWLLGGVLLAQTAIFLLPLGNERRLAHPDSGRRPPLPVLLGYFSTATLAITLTVILLACHTAPLAGRLDGSLVLTIAALLLGGIGAVVDLRRREAGRLPWVAVVGAALASVVLVGGVLRLAPEPAIKWAAPMRMLLPVAAALPAGFLYALLVRLGADHLARTLPALLPWLWTTVGLSVAGGTIGALWLAQYGGWLAVGATVVGCWVTTLVIGIITTVLARCRTARITTAA